MQVVDRRERQPPRPGERLRRGDADEQRADQAGPRGDGDELDVLERRVREPERLAQHGRDQLEVPARGDLGHDPAEARVQLGLGGDDAGRELAVARDERRGGLVAGGLDPEDQAPPGAGTGSFHMIRASSRLSV